jgi:L-lactate permease
MPVDRALASVVYGFFYGLWPIAWIIIAAVFVYKISVKTGQFDIIRSSILSITPDQRLQMLIVGFSFGAFLEGAAGLARRWRLPPRCWSASGLTRCMRLACA